ncbi:transposase [Methylobacterium sp. DCY52]|uniref:transposase n=1 Tax=Methylobacterium sp. DCY52 TaxID=739139 RepID=UPI00406C3913
MNRSDYDAGKKIKGRKRHILVDTHGLLMHALVHPASVQDRTGGVLVMARSASARSWCGSTRTAAIRARRSRLACAGCAGGSS